MKRMLALVVSALFLVIPMLSALANFGWEDDLFVLYDAEMAFAIPEGAVVASDEELAAENAALGSFEPTTIFMVTDPATGIIGVIGTYELDDPDEIGEYALALANAMAETMEADPSAIDMSEEATFFDNESILIHFSTDDMGVMSHVFASTSGAYAFVLIYPTVADRAAGTFLNQLFMLGDYAR